MTHLTHYGLILALLAASSLVLATPHPGQTLHTTHNCLNCHVDKPYNPNKTDSYAKLLKSVRFCNDNLGTGMFDDEIEELTDYLNQTYYHHKKP